MMYFVLNMIDYFVSHSLTECFFIFVAKTRVDLAVKNICASIRTSKLNEIKKKCIYITPLKY